MTDHASLRTSFSYPGISSAPHFVQVCQNLTSQAEILTQYIIEGLTNGEGIVIIARVGLRKALSAKFKDLGLDLNDLKAQGKIRIFDADFMLSLFNFDDTVDRAAFEKCVLPPVLETKLKFGKVRAFGEMVDILWKDGWQDLAIELEGWWGEICEEHNLMLLCTYLLESLDPAEYNHSLKRICNTHNHLVPITTFNSSPSEGMVDSFEAAWNNVVDKFKFSKHISSISPTV